MIISLLLHCLEICLYFVLKTHNDRFVVWFELRVLVLINNNNFLIDMQPS